MPAIRLDDIFGGMDAVAQLNAALAGRYILEREIGVGGMARVYLARDPRHERFVALKVLSPELTTILGAERFLSEIKVTANLQHPHLLPLFDSGEAHGLLFYVMPYVEGESLRARLRRERQLPIDDAIHIASAVAGAVDYAHRHGVIHRDLKPENILLHEGQPLVADFGIALAVSAAGGHRITQAGISVGTPQYMSPEQATGDRVIDGRTDIYSLAAVTYEMLTGDPPHIGSTAQAIIAKVITERPQSVRAQRESVPAHVEGAIQKALAKLPADRWATARDFAEALVGRAVALPTHVVTPASVARDVPESARRTRWTVGLLAALAAVSLAAAGIEWWKLLRPAPAEVVRVTLSVPDSMALQDLATEPLQISPDGRAIVYTGRAADTTGARLARIYYRPLDDLRVRALRGLDVAGSPQFSTDGRWVSARSQTSVVKIPVDADGPATTIWSAGDGPNAPCKPPRPSCARLGLGWLEDGSIIVPTGDALVRVAANGRRTENLIEGIDGRSAHDPYVLPDNRTVLFLVGSDTAQQLAVLRLSNKKFRRVDGEIANILGYIDGWLVFGTLDGAVAAAPFDPARTTSIAGATVLESEVHRMAQVSRSAAPVQASLSRKGSLVYVRGSARLGVWLYDARGRQLKPLFPGTAPRVSPDGQRVVAASASDITESDLWIYDIRSGQRSLLLPKAGRRPVWTPDGKRIAYIRDSRDPVAGVWWVPVDRSTSEVLLLATDSVTAVAFTPDGKSVVVARSDAQRSVWRIPLHGDRSPIQVAQRTNAFAISPDGRWIAYVSNESGRPEVYVKPLAAGGARVQISADGGSQPVWMANGRALVYLHNPAQIMAASLSVTKNAVSVDNRTLLFSDPFPNATPRATYDINPRTGEFVFEQPIDAKHEIVVVLNWFDEVRKRLTTSR